MELDEIWTFAADVVFECLCRIVPKIGLNINIGDSCIAVDSMGICFLANFKILYQILKMCLFAFYLIFQIFPIQYLLFRLLRAIGAHFAEWRAFLFVPTEALK
jgi:hypothetical protein